MEFTFSALDEEGVPVVEFVTRSENCANILMASMGLDYEAHEPGATWFFVDNELSAAEAAIAVAINVRTEYKVGLGFLSSVRSYLKAHNMMGCEITIN